MIQLTKHILQTIKDNIDVWTVLALYMGFFVLYTIVGFFFPLIDLPIDTVEEHIVVLISVLAYALYFFTLIIIRVLHKAYVQFKDNEKGQSNG